MASVSAFYKYLRKKRIIKEDPMEFIDRPKKDTDIMTQTFLTREQVTLMREKLQENVADNGYKAKELQLYALLSLSTMARVNAVAHIRWEQIDFDNRIIKISFAATSMLSHSFVLTKEKIDEMIRVGYDFTMEKLSTFFANGIEDLDYIYKTIEETKLFQLHAQEESRSLMNVTFRTGDADLDKKFVAAAAKRGLVSLGGHRKVGGMRASIYNAMPVEGVEKLCAFIKEFDEKCGEID
jgi:hypothetical protein